MKTIKDIVQEFDEQFGPTTDNPMLFAAVKSSLRSAIKQAFEETRVEEIYGQTTPMASMEENFQNALLRQHVESFNQALTELKKKQEEFLKE